MLSLANDLRISIQDCDHVCSRHRKRTRPHRFGLFCPPLASSHPSTSDHHNNPSQSFFVVPYGLRSLKPLLHERQLTVSTMLQRRASGVNRRVFHVLFLINPKIVTTRHFRHSPVLTFMFDVRSLECPSVLA